jgi:amino acid adenylation domain-containing protein
VRQNPQALALVYEEEQLSYAQLNARANPLAHYLRKLGLKPDDRVALCVERSVDMVVGLLAILKAGGAYVPLDPSYPAERLAYMLKDSAPAVLLTHAQIPAALREQLSAALDAGRASPVPVIDLQADALMWAHEPASNPDRTAAGLTARHLAYVIYTSGSTGQPKGVMIDHQSVLNLWYGLEQQVYSRSRSCERVALNASYNFDASVQQLVQLASGHALFPVPEPVRRDPMKLLRFIEQHQIHAMDCTPSQLRSWLSAGLLTHRELSLRVMLVGGEAIDPPLWRDLCASEAIAFYNVYGPTECTVDATLACLDDGTRAPHIGRPMQNRRVYILDGGGQPVPAGVTGELYIGGEGIGRGYLNRPELTAENFVPDPFIADPAARMYKTGDRARWLADGTIEYLGRNDHQVKIRGYRIELGEIEAKLLQCAGVREALVMARAERDGEMRLVAYLIGEPSLSVEGLRAQLMSELPQHMVPVAYVQLEQWPLTPNGKLDRNVLPTPQADAYSRREYEPPQGEIEQTLAHIWSDLLQVERVGRRDQFFELGGHSLLGVQLIERLREQGLHTDVKTLFSHPALCDLAQALSAREREIDVPANLIPQHCTRLTPEMLPLVQLSTAQIERIVSAVPSTLRRTAGSGRPRAGSSHLPRAPPQSATPASASGTAHPWRPACRPTRPGAHVACRRHPPWTPRATAPYPGPAP